MNFRRSTLRSFGKFCCVTAMRSLRSILRKIPGHRRMPLDWTRCSGSRVGCKAKHPTRVPLQRQCWRRQPKRSQVALYAERTSEPAAKREQRESLLGAQTEKSVFQLIQRVKINLQPAMTRTVASKIEMVRTGNLRLPKCEPIAPPMIAAAERITANAGMDCLALINPARPAIEFTKINNAETADACFVFAHLEKSKRGVRKIPPPVPVRPERNPIPEPTASAVGKGGGTTAGGSPRRKNNRTAEKSSTSPMTILKIPAGNWR